VALTAAANAARANARKRGEGAEGEDAVMEERPLDGWCGWRELLFFFFLLLNLFHSHLARDIFVEIVTGLACQP